MKAILFTLFAPGYVQDTIIPRLRGRGVHVARTMEPKRAGDTRIVEDLVLYMHEFGPHADDRIVRDAAKSQSKKFMYLTRKAANWPEELRDPADIPTSGSPLAEATLLGSERLDAMLRALVALRDVGQSYDTIAPQLSRFWRGAETAPQDGRALRRLIETVRERGEPAWFAAWRPSGQAVAQGPASANGTAAPPPDDEDDDDAELLKMFEEENERLQKELTAGRDVLDGLRKELADALDGVTLWKGEFEKLQEKHVATMNAAHVRGVEGQKRVEELMAEVHAGQTRIVELCADVERLQLHSPPAAPQANGLGKMLAQVRPLVPALMTADEALDRLAAYAAKQGG